MSILSKVAKPYINIQSTFPFRNNKNRMNTKVSFMTFLLALADFLFFEYFVFSNI